MSAVNSVILCNRLDCEHEIRAETFEDAWQQAVAEGWIQAPLDVPGLMGWLCRSHAEVADNMDELLGEVR